MDNFQAIGQLVIKAQDLLDSIKGGAIRQMETVFDALKQTINSEWSAIKNKANSDLSAVIGRVDTETVRGEITFTSLNYNDDFRDFTVIDSNHTLPIGVSLSTDLLRCLTSELISVQSGVDPETRPAFVQDLLAASGAGAKARYFFGYSFKILKLTVRELPSQSISDFMHLSLDYHCSVAGGLTTMFYQKRNDGAWEQVKKMLSKSPASYTHFGANVLPDGAAIGDVFYIALPAVVAGFDWSSKHFKYNNLRNKQVRYGQ